MELCTSTRCLPNRLSNLTSLTPQISSLQWKSSLPLKSNSIALNIPGLRYNYYSSIKATASEETSSEANQYVKDEPDVVSYSSTEATTPEVASNEANQHVKGETEDEVPVNDGQSEENSGFGGFGLFKVDDDATDAADDQFPQFEFLNKLKMELDLEDSFSIALLGVGGITALWLAANIVGSIDRIPLFPKLMELVGLGYSIWFTTRYLLFKRNRDELASKIEEVKQQVLGSKN
ncbi:putative cyanobacterial aminoacyl-tRNA synthetase, CAAD domain, protein CURVATURE THYLAKOID 1 [Helianthus debilis subsp. tardiflorus]